MALCQSIRPPDTSFSPDTPVHVGTCLSSCGLGLHQGVNTHSHQHSVIPNSNYLTAAQIIENGKKKQLLLPDCLCSFWQRPLTCCSCVPSLTPEKVLWASKVAKTRSPPGISQAAYIKLELLSHIWSHNHIPGLSSVRQPLLDYPGHIGILWRLL